MSHFVKSGVFVSRFILLMFVLGLTESNGFSKNKVGCDLEFKKLSVCGSIQWTKLPKNVELVTEEDQAEFNLNLESKKKEVRNKYPDHVTVKLFMPSMRHGSAPTQVIPVLDSKGIPVPGKYKVKHVLFTMPGHWEIQVELKSNNQVVDKAVFSYVHK